MAAPGRYFHGTRRVAGRYFHGTRRVAGRRYHVGTSKVHSGSVWVVPLPDSGTLATFFDAYCTCSSPPVDYTHT